MRCIFVLFCSVCYSQQLYVDVNLSLKIPLNLMIFGVFKIFFYRGRPEIVTLVVGMPSVECHVILNKLLLQKKTTNSKAVIGNKTPIVMFSVDWNSGTKRPLLLRTDWWWRRRIPVWNSRVWQPVVSSCTQWSQPQTILYGHWPVPNYTVWRGNLWQRRVFKQLPQCH